MLVPVFETAALCLCSDMFKTKIASEVTNPVAELKTLFIFQQGQPVEKNCYQTINFNCFLLRSFYRIFLTLYLCSEFLSAYTFLLLVHSGQAGHSAPHLGCQIAYKSFL